LFIPFPTLRFVPQPFSKLHSCVTVMKS
jgi:hypothetical protein